LERYVEGRKEGGRKERKKGKKEREKGKKERKERKKGRKGKKERKEGKKGKKERKKEELETELQDSCLLGESLHLSQAPVLLFLVVL
jgi:hypothetical protein